MNWILGSGGFIGSALSSLLKRNGVSVIEVDRKWIDFRSKEQVKGLSNLIREDDTIFFLIGNVPCRENTELDLNIEMLKNLTCSLSDDFRGKFVYVSSDAVYSENDQPITEDDETIPSSIHGQMHLIREKIVSQRFQDDLLLLRPSLIYGKNDPHNSYGPNRFIRQLQACQPISLIGGGEELRDHIHISEVAEIICNLVSNNSKGTFNISSGKISSFKKIADDVISYFECKNLREKMVFVDRLESNKGKYFSAISNEKLLRELPGTKFVDMMENWIKEFAK